ncbi:NAF1-domain-containing protein [Testicularia cyperi]|uniref:H/ACA ribonucleoprotein complex non-core subunit NAF1 n=1 Tax=Testicularia cyperi TaxID=1882483 RepID=A0A317XQW3_9BASI|nr:NAF1-domain-containing protein [Testicularia cyperi]
MADSEQIKTIDEAVSFQETKPPPETTVELAEASAQHDAETQEQEATMTLSADQKDAMADASGSSEKDDVTAVITETPSLSEITMEATAPPPADADSLPAASDQDPEATRTFASTVPVQELEVEEPTETTTDASHEQNQQTQSQQHSSPENKDDESDFVAPDLEHIVSTGAAQDSTVSTDALRELVAKARELTGQARETLPPGFEDDGPLEVELAESDEVEARGQKRKAEEELVEAINTNGGIEQVQRAVETSQNPETKSLLQKALSSLTGLVTRKPRVEVGIAQGQSSTEAGGSTAAEKSNVKQGAVAASESDSDSDSDDDSSSDDDSDSSSSDDDEEDAKIVGLALDADDDDDEDGGGGGGSTVPATKNEILAPQVDLPAIEELSDADKAAIRPLGRVHSIVDSVVVIEQEVRKAQNSEASSAPQARAPVDSTGRPGEEEGEYSVLDTGSLLCFEDGKVLGLVFETFGSIHSPMYSLRFPSAAAIDKEQVQVGKPVFYLPSQSTYVMTRLLKAMKGSDASNMWDEEVAEDEIDYSDDEAEAEAKRRNKAIRSGKMDENGNRLPHSSDRSNKRQKQHGGQSSSQQQQQHQQQQHHHHHPHYQQQQQQQQHQQQYPYSYPSYHQQRPGPQQQHPQSRRPPPPMQPLPAPPITLGQGPLGLPFQPARSTRPAKPPSNLPAKPVFDAGSQAIAGASASPRAIVSYADSGAGGDAKSSFRPAPRSRTSTEDGSIGTHSRLSSGPGSLPPKPIGAALPRAPAASAEPVHRRQNSVTLGSPGQSPAMGARSGSAHGQAASLGWNGAPASALPMAAANPSAGTPPTGTAGAYGAAQPYGGPPGHYNPRFAGYWQQPAQQPFYPAHGAHTSIQSPNSSLPHQPAPAGQAYSPSGAQTYGAYPGSVYPSAGGAPSWTGQHQYQPAPYAGYGDATAAAATTPTPPAGTPASQPYAPQQGGYAAGYAADSALYAAYGYGAPGSQPPANTERYDPRAPTVGNTSTPTAPSSQQNPP